MEQGIRIRTVILMCMLLSVIAFSNAQNLYSLHLSEGATDSLEKAKYNPENLFKLPHIIKTNPTLYLRGNFNLSYDFFVYKRVSVELQAGIIIPSQIWIAFVESMLYHIPEEDLARQYYSGYEYRIHAKFYFTKDAPFKSMYVGPLFLFSKQQGDKVWVTYPDTERSKYNFDYERLESGKVKYKTFGVIIGYMFSVKKKWFFDAYLGIGQERIEEFDRYVYDMKPIPENFEFVPHPLEDWSHPSTRFFTGIKVGYNLR